MVLAVEHQIMTSFLVNDIAASSTTPPAQASTDEKTITTRVKNKGAGGDLTFASGETISLSLDDWIRCAGIDGLDEAPPLPFPPPAFSLWSMARCIPAVWMRRRG